MRATFKLLNSYFWKTIYGPIISFVLPVLLLLVLGNIMRVQYVYPGIIALSLLFIGILALPLSIMELKSSSLFKYIGASPVDNKKFSIVAIGYYVFIAIITVFITLIATMIFSKLHMFRAGDVVFSNGFKYGILGGIFYTAKGVFSFLIAVLLHLLMVIAFGLAIATFAKTPQQALTISIVIIIPSMFLSGMILSVDIIAQNQIMQWVSRMIPFRYSTGNIVVASTPLDQIGDVFSLISLKEKAIIFNGIDPNTGAVISKEWILNANGQQQYVDVRINSSTDIMHLIEQRGGDYNFNFITDKYLFEKIIFLKSDSQLSLIPASDNNIFNWIDSFGVRRVPDTDQIQKFIQDYLTNKFGADGTGDAGNVVSGIKSGDFGWMNLFLNQNMTLYTVAERVLNIAVPIALASGSLYYVAKNFKWSSR